MMAGPASSAISDFGGAAQMLFAAGASSKKADTYKVMSQADLLKGKGDILEAENYDRASVLALKNKEFTEQSTAVQQAQASRSIFMSEGGARAAIGASGLAESGSAEDVLRASAMQGSLQKSVLAQQGVITEEGFQEQHDTYVNMSGAAHLASDAETLASKGHLLAAEAEEDAATGMKIGAGIKVLAGVAAIAAAPFTGGASLALGAAMIPGNWGEQS